MPSLWVTEQAPRLPSNGTEHTCTAAAHQEPSNAGAGPQQCPPTNARISWSQIATCRMCLVHKRSSAFVLLHTGEMSATKPPRCLSCSWLTVTARMLIIRLFNKTCVCFMARNHQLVRTTWCICGGAAHVLMLLLFCQKPVWGHHALWKQTVGQ